MTPGAMAAFLREGFKTGRCALGSCSGGKPMSVEVSNNAVLTADDQMARLAGALSE